MSPLSNESLAAYRSAPEAATNMVVFMNLLGAMLLGLVVGYERSYHCRVARFEGVADLSLSHARN